MKWSELDNKDFYQPLDENKKTIRGYWLIKQKIDLENIPVLFKQEFTLFPRINSNNFVIDEKKIYLSDIAGTSHSDYGNMTIIKSYMNLKRADSYIEAGEVTKQKYARMLRMPVNEQPAEIILVENRDGTYFVEGNGNHRIILYKMMLLSEIALKHPNYINGDVNLNSKLFKDIKKKYWLNAKVKKYF